MSKIFEYITAHPLQALIVLVIGISIAYTTVRILKGFFGLFTRKRKKRKEQEKQERQAELVVEKLGGVESFSEVVAFKVLTKQRENIEKIKQRLQKIEQMDRCPIELRAYIETVLKANPTLLLQYQEHKAKLVGKESIKTKTKSKEQLEQKEKIEIASNTSVAKENIEQQTKEEITYV